MKNLITILLTSLVSACLAVWLYNTFEEPQKVFESGDPFFAKNINYGDDPYASSHFQRPFLSSAPTDFIAAAEAVTPAVVNIRTLNSSTSHQWWGGGSYASSSGSGVIVSSDGFIVTNNHVIEDGGKYEVTLNDRREYTATLIATDPSTDIALLKIEENNLPYLPFGNSDSLRVGEWVLAVGNPFNLSSTVTAGIVSALGRSIDVLEGDYSIESFIQTDAAVNPGNSGGALVNTNGELVGINTAIMTRSGRYEGYSFAVPANLAQKVIRDLRDFGEVQRGLLGIRIGAVNLRIAQQAGLPSVEGVYINAVIAGGGAAEAGLKGGDIIIGLDGSKINTVPQLQEYVGRLRPGSVIKVEYYREGRSHRTSVILKDKTLSKGYAVKSSGEDVIRNLGFQLRELSTDERRRMRVLGAYVVRIQPGSTIDKTQMEPGYIITKVDNVKVSSIQEVMDELDKKRGKDIYLEGIYEQYQGDFYYTFKVK